VLERLIEARREVALARRQQPVAGAVGEPVVVAHHGHRRDLHRHAQVRDQAAHDHEVLVVLLAEHRDVRLHDLQQLGRDRRDALEVARPRLALEDARQLRHVDARRALEAGREHLEGGRREQEVGAGLARQLLVVLGGARVAAVVLLRAELQRIDERAHDHARCALAGVGDQRQVALVQAAHRLHQRDRLAGGAPLRHPLAHRLDAGDRLHLSPATG